MRYPRRHRLLLAAAVVLASCSLNVAEPSDQPSDPATETFASALNIDISKMQKTTAGTYYKDITVGAGATLTKPTVVVMSYDGFLKDGSHFLSGDHQTVSMTGLPFGLQDGMPGMREGGVRVIVIPSALGYGNANVAGVPPNSTLVFNVRLDQVP